MRRPIAALAVLIACVAIPASAQAKHHRHWRVVHGRTVGSQTSRGARRPAMEKRSGPAPAGTIGQAPREATAPTTTQATWTGRKANHDSTGALSCTPACSLATINATTNGTGGEYTWTIIEGCRWDWEYTFLSVEGTNPLIGSPPTPAPQCEHPKTIYEASSTSGTLKLWMELGPPGKKTPEEPPPPIGPTKFIPSVGEPFSVPWQIAEQSLVLEVRYTGAAPAWIALVTWGGLA